MIAKVWVGDVMYLADDAVADEILRLSCENKEMADKLLQVPFFDRVVAEKEALICEGERKDTKIGTLRDALEAAMVLKDTGSIPEVVIEQCEQALALVSEGLAPDV